MTSSLNLKASHPSVTERKLASLLLPALFFLLFPFLLFSDVLSSGGGSLIGTAGSDTINQYYSWREFFRNTLLEQGEIPFWNPSIFAGSPYFAGLQSALFYPPVWVHLLVPTPLAISLFCGFHLSLAGFFTFLFARSNRLSLFASLSSGACFAFSLPLILHILAGHISNVATIAWIPVVLYALRRLAFQPGLSASLFLGVSVALQFLAGHPQYVYYSLALYTLYAAFLGVPLLKEIDQGEKYFLLFFLLVSVLFCCSLIAVQLMPAFELYFSSARSESLPANFTSSFFLPVENLFTFLFPTFLGDGLHLPYWGRFYFAETELFLGIPALFFLLFSLLNCFFVNSARKETLFWWGCAVFFLFVALGIETPLYNILSTVVPLFDSFRGISKISILALFSLSLLVGYGVEKGVRIVQEKTLSVKLFLLLFFLSLSITVWSFTEYRAHSFPSGWWVDWAATLASLPHRYTSAPHLQSPYFLLEGYHLFMQNLFLASLFLSIMLAVLLFLQTQKKAKVFAAPLFFLLVAIGSITTTYPQIEAQPVENAQWEKELVYLLKKEGNFRIYTTSIQESDWGMQYGIQNISGYDANIPQGFNRLLNESQDWEKGRINIAYRLDKITEMIKLAGLKYVLSSADHPLHQAELKEVYTGVKHRLYELKKPLRIIRTVSEVQVTASDDETFQQMHQLGKEVRRVAVIEKKRKKNLYDVEKELKRAYRFSSASEVHHVSITGNHIEAVVTVPKQKAEQGRGAFLVIAVNKDPGWKASLNGVETETYLTYGSFMGIFLQEGENKIELSYQPVSFSTGAWSSSCAALFLIGYLSYSFARRFKRGRSFASPLQ